MARVRRINRGKGHSYELDGQPCDGVTSILNDGIPKPALVGWAARCAADLVRDGWTDLEALTPPKRYDAVLNARWNQLKEAAARGTDVHDYAMRLAQDEEVEPPAELVGHVDAYLKFVNDYDPQEVLVEAVVVNYQWRYAGTLDLIAKLNDGNTWLLDWKTGQSGIFPEVALQLAAYANADACVMGDGDEIAMPTIDRAGAVWLRTDGYDLHPVDISTETFRTFLYAQQVAHYTRDAKDNRHRYIQDSHQP